MPAPIEEYTISGDYPLNFSTFATNIVFMFQSSNKSKVISTLKFLIIKFV